MTAHHHPVKTAVALSLALGAFAPAAAQARPMGLIPQRPPQDARIHMQTSSLAGTRTSTPEVVTVSNANGFAWGDAAIGAAGGLGLAMVTAGGTVLVSGRRRRYATR
jgi:hypothetical protein